LKPAKRRTGLSFKPPSPLANLYGAKLVIAKLDRLSRDAHFLLGLEKAGIDFVAADMPNANRLTVGIMAMVADEERRMISKRTKEALAAAKARGQRLGGVRYRADGTRVIITKETQQAAITARRERAMARTAVVAPVIKELQEGGAESLRAIASGLNAAGIPTASGGGQWSPAQVLRTLERL
jgi:DNA invertase Pin-like site-specific DNA recombinase